MDIGKIINHLSSRLKSRSQVVHTSLGIGNAQGKILNFILVESTLHPVYQKDIEREFSLRPSTVTEMLKSLESRDLIVRIPDERRALQTDRIYRKSRRREGRLKSGDP